MVKATTQWFIVDMIQQEDKSFTFTLGHKASGY